MSFLHRRKNKALESDKTSPYPPKSKPRWYRRKPVLIVAVLLILVLGWVGFTAVRAMGRISDGGFSAKDFLNLLSMKNESLKGESDGRTNILLLGYGGAGHPGGLLSDTNILFNYHYGDAKMAMVSFPRDLYVPIAQNGGSNKLNYAYSYGETNKEKTGGGGAVASETISDIAGVPVHYYISLDFVGFKELIDELGGVTVNVEKAINDPYYPADYFDKNGNYVKTDAYTTFKLSAGKQKLDGVTALKYARSRETTSDFDRAARQQNLLKAIKEKATSLGVLSNPKKVVDIINILGNHLHTNLGAGEMESLIGLLRDASMDNLQNKVLDNSAEGLLTDANIDGGYYLEPRGGSFKAVQELVENIFGSDDTTSSAAIDTASLKDLSIEIQNGSGVAGKARQLSTLLEGEGLEIAALTTAAQTQKTTVLYDYTSGKGDAMASLVSQKLNGVDVSVLKRSDSGSNLDFKLILGEDSAGA